MDRAWAVYALADLEPAYRDHARWHIAADGRPALLLVYRGFRLPVLFAQGAAEDLAPLLAEAASEPRFYLSVRPEVILLLRAAGYEIPDAKRMWRMVLDPHAFAPIGHRAVRLGPADEAELASLYADGEAVGEAPPFFEPGMLRHGVYYGVREGGAIVAAGGTHVLAEQESVAAIGNVYTRGDCRRRGWGSQVTSAVAGELLMRGVRLVVLNVAEENAAARRVYERLGFREYCEYREGLALRRPSADKAGR